MESDDDESYDEVDLDLQEEQDDDIAHTTDGAEADDDEDDDDEVDDELESDETDEYFSPIDSVCEVSFFAEWCAKGMSQPYLAQNQDILAQHDLSACQRVSQEYVALYQELHKAEEEAHSRRALAATTGAANSVQN